MNLLAALLLFAFVLPKVLLVLASDESNCPSICSCHKNAPVHCAFPTGRYNLSNYPSLSAYHEHFEFKFDGITSLEGAELSSLRNATFLDLSNNQISEIPPGEFSAMDKLQELRLDNNAIVNISAETFSDMEHLTTLDLSFNQIQFIHDTAFANLPSLKILNLKHNEIQDIDEKFNSLVGLVKIKLSHNSLPAVENASFRYMVSLQHLDLSSNRIAYISPDAFYGLRNLLSLRLKGNPVTSMSWILSLDNSRSLRQLVNFDLSIMALQTMPRDVFQVSPFLQYVYLSENPWRCDSSLAFLSDAMKKDPDKFPDAQTTRCAYPPELDGVVVKIFPDAEALEADRDRRFPTNPRVTPINSSTSSSAGHGHQFGNYNSEQHIKTRQPKRTTTNRQSREQKRRERGHTSRTSPHRSKQQKRRKNKTHTSKSHHGKKKRKKYHKSPKGHKHKKNGKERKDFRSDQDTNTRRSDPAQLAKTATSKQENSSSSNPVILGFLIFCIVVIVVLVALIVAMKYKARIRCLPRQAANTDRGESKSGTIVRGQNATGRGNTSSSSSRRSSRPRVFVSSESENGFSGTVHDATDNTMLTMDIDASERDSEATPL